MLHSIQEVCELTDNSRSRIYEMLNAGALSYVVSKDGKRKVETSELLRVFPKLELPTIPATQTVIDKSSAKEISNKQEIYELRGMITDLKSEINNVLEDNRRLLRLLEHQTINSKSARPPATEISHDWKDYKKKRESGVGNDKATDPGDQADHQGGFFEKMKSFFFRPQ